MSATARRLLPIVCGVTLLWSSLLLFLIEPMVGKLLLPLMGGTPAVWNGCLVFFQATLLGGYLYAHLLVTRLSPTMQRIVHAVVLLLPLAFLPPGLKALGWLGAVPEGHPLLWLMGVLALSCGPGFFVLSTSSPLLTAWYQDAVATKKDRAYALYAASNAGSFLALLGYPFVVEPLLHLEVQQEMWAYGYGLFAAMSLGIVALTAKARRVVAAKTVVDEAPAPSWVERGRWVLLAAAPASLMLGVTSFMTVDVAAVPMLWMLPLMLYLLTFAVVFSKWGAGIDRLLQRLAPWLVAALLVLIFSDARRHLVLIVGSHLSVFVLLTFACHGRLAQRRPSPRYLTQFFLCMSLGGVLGGLINACVAPLVFSRVAEYPLMLAATVLILGLATTKDLADQRGPWQEALRAVFAAAAFAGVLYGFQYLMAEQDLERLVTFVKPLTDSDNVARLVITFGLPLLTAVLFFFRPVYTGAALIGIVALGLFHDTDGNVLMRSRSFFGVLTVKEYAGDIHSLVNGGILHGEQKITDGESRAAPRSYYHVDGPLGQMMSLVHENRARPAIAAVGLGAGTVAAYGSSRNELTFYELDPNVERMARDPRYFTYVDDCLKRGCSLKVVLGDGRLNLAAATERYDLIILDAFNSDAIPVHLLTLEALDVYLSRLKPGGLIAYHISNRYLDLEPVLLNLGMARRLIYGIAKDEGDEDSGRGGSTWVAMAPQDELIDQLLQRDESPWGGLEAKRGVGLWADDYANVVRAFTWY